VFEAVCQVRMWRSPAVGLGLRQSIQGLLYVLCYRMEAFSEGSAHATAALRALPLDRCAWTRCRGAAGTFL
jgi:hypothetical protein